MSPPEPPRCFLQDPAIVVVKSGISSMGLVAVRHDGPLFHGWLRRPVEKPRSVQV